MLVVIPSNQPRTVAARMIQISDACVEPTTQSSLTERVFAVTRATMMMSRATSKNAET
jgi:hypothetical protein